jgi:hypothetical protein
VALWLVAQSCAGPDAGGAAGRLAGAPTSLERLGQRVVAALAAGDAAGLERLRLSEYEHNGLVWPELPAAAPEANFPVDFAWENIERRNGVAVVNLLTRYAGRRLRETATECIGPRRRFASFEVLTDCYVSFEAEGRLQTQQLFKDVVVMDGGYKIFRYYHDRPAPQTSLAS